MLRTTDVYNNHVKEYIDKFMDLGLYKETFDSFIQLLPNNSRVIEMGCGPGNVIKYCNSKRPDLKLLGIDLAPKMIEAAKKENPHAEFRLMDICNAGELTDRFNAVIAAFCIPYLSFFELKHLFSIIRKITLDKAIIYLSLMEGERDKSGFEKTSFTGDDEIYINYYTRKEFESLMIEYDFKIIKFFERDYPESDGSTTIDLIYLAIKL